METLPAELWARLVYSGRREKPPGLWNPCGSDARHTCIQESLGWRENGVLLPMVTDWRESGDDTFFHEMMGNLGEFRRRNDVCFFLWDEGNREGRTIRVLRSA